MGGQIIIKFLKNRFDRAILLVLSLVICFGIGISVYSLTQKKGIVGERLQVLSDLEAKHAALERKLAEATSSAFIEREARNKLGLAKEGEAIVILDKEKVQALVGQGGKVIQERSEEHTSE